MKCWLHLAFYGGSAYVVRKCGWFKGLELLLEAADYIPKVSMHTDETAYCRTAKVSFCILEKRDFNVNIFLLLFVTKKIDPHVMPNSVPAYPYSEHFLSENTD